MVQGTRKKVHRARQKTWEQRISITQAPCTCYRVSCILYHAPCTVYLAPSSYILKPHSFYFREIPFHECCPRHGFSMTREQMLHIKLGQALDAFFEGLPVSAGKVCSPETLIENHIACDEGFILRPVDADRPRRMPRGMNDLESHIAHLEFPFLEEDLRFELPDAHGGSVMRGQFLDEIQFSFMEGDKRPEVGKGANALPVIRMGVGQNNEINVLRGDGEL